MLSSHLCFTLAALVLDLFYDALHAVNGEEGAVDKKVGSEDGDEGHIVVEIAVIVLQVGGAKQEEDVAEKERSEFIEDFNPVHKLIFKRLPNDQVHHLQGRGHKKRIHLHEQVL